MEYLIDEQMEAEKRIPKNVKFNKAFDISKVCAEYIKDTSNEQFSKMLRDGIPQNVVNILLRPQDYEALEIDRGTDEYDDDNIDNRIHTTIALKRTQSKSDRFQCPSKKSQVIFKKE